MPSLLINGSAGRGVSDLNIIAVLNDPNSWSYLSEQARRLVYTTVPQITDPITGHVIQPDINVHPLRNPLISGALSEYLQSVRANVGNGFHRQAWVDEAREALVRNAAGGFDESREAACRAYWGKYEPVSPISALAPPSTQAPVTTNHPSLGPPPPPPDASAPGASVGNRP